jgi:hypothetical protein
MKSLILASFLFLAACSSLQTQNEKTAAAYIAVDTVAQSVGNAQLAGLITEDKEDELLDRLVTVMAYIELAETKQEDSYLNLALIILTSIEKELKQ